MHEVSEGDMDAIVRPTNEFEITELAVAETELPQNLQYNGATLPVRTQTPPPHSPPEDTSVSSAKPPPCPRFKDRYAAPQACAGDLPDVCLLGANYMIYGVYQDWLHQNPG